ncbi:hypothetical protein GCM10007977_100460 [Dactylosporangium sucinum]|uniref:Uncharacterized protein n=1 Tax=Dactylosporangium sucinum TaxID=1424081 RepID=A0A917UCS5_9ACTN|nr:hypothetical protein GCM10007977_100460 [Dactylosporangium sucinum]
MVSRRNAGFRGVPPFRAAPVSRAFPRSRAFRAFPCSRLFPRFWAFPRSRAFLAVPTPFPAVPPGSRVLRGVPWVPRPRPASWPRRALPAVHIGDRFCLITFTH